MFYRFKKSYDSIHKENVINVLKEFQFLKKLLHLVEINMETAVKVNIESFMSNPVPTKQVKTR